MYSAQSLNALLGMSKIPVALLFTSFLITFITCKAETCLNLNSAVAVLIWAVVDYSSLGCILWASSSPIEKIIHQFVTQ